MVAEKKLSWTQPICERCWIEWNSEWDDDDNLVGIRRPVRINAEATEVERCAWCGRPTIVGIYKRVDPISVPYPRGADDDDPNDLDAPVVQTT